MHQKGDEKAKRIAGEWSIHTRSETHIGLNEKHIHAGSTDPIMHPSAGLLEAQDAGEANSLAKFNNKNEFNNKILKHQMC